MSIRRTHLAFEDHYTQIPNQWIRDQRLSRKARGLLVELMSHRVGWQITIESLVEGGPEGRDAIRTAILELEQCGYLVRERERGEDGRLGGVDYLIQDPWAGADNPTQVQPTLADHPPKKNISTEDQEEELSRSRHFDVVWDVWPKKTAKKDARRAWERATRGKSLDEIQEIASKLILLGRAHRTNTPPQFIPMLSTVVNGERWDDPLPVSRDRGARDPEPQRPGGIVIPPGHVPVWGENGYIVGSRPAS